MGHAGRLTIIAGNWKMHKTIEEALVFLEQMELALPKTEKHVYLAVPFTALDAVATTSQLAVIGAQNVNEHHKGAFTGEISCDMLKEAGAKFVLLGHSERRHLFHEGNEVINRKVKAVLESGLQPVLCIGETSKVQEAGATHFVLKTQLHQCLEGLTANDLQTLILAYEPVWAIGTGKHATPEQAEEVHHFCRSLIAEKWGDELAAKMPILYGGSVNPDNAKKLLDQPDVDGLLVGGASLEVETFCKIIEE